MNEDHMATTRMMLRISKYQPDVAANRHWLARVAIALWVLHIPVIGILAPQTMVGRALVESGEPGMFVALVLCAVSIASLVDSAINTCHPNRYTLWLMRERHVFFLVMATAQVIAGAGFMERSSGVGVVWITFITPAVLCVVVTFLDLHLRFKELLGCLQHDTP
jgi:hypothetical protein